MSTKVIVYLAKVFRDLFYNDTNDVCEHFNYFWIGDTEFRLRDMPIAEKKYLTT